MKQFSLHGWRLNGYVVVLVLFAGLMSNPTTSNCQQTGILRGLSSNITLAAHDDVAIPFDTTLVNVGAFADDPGIISTAQHAGLHNVAGSVLLHNGNASNSMISGVVKVNGSTVDTFESTLRPSSFHELSFSTIANLNPGDEVAILLLAIHNNVTVHAGLTNASITTQPELNGILRGLSSNVVLLAHGDVAIPFDTTLVNVGEFADDPGIVSTAQHAGLHTVAGSVLVRNGNSSNNLITGVVKVNGNTVDAFQYTLRPSSFHELSFSTIANLNPGDDVAVLLLANENNVTVFAGQTNASMTAQPSTTGILRGLSSNIALPSVDDIAIPFNTTLVNVGGYADDTGIVSTAQHAGLHTIAGSVLVHNGNSSINLITGVVQVNGNTVDAFHSTLNPSSFHEFSFSTIADLNPGDEVAVRLVAQNTNVTLHAGLTNASMTFTPLAGDFNLDGNVDAADYVMWRKNFADDDARFDEWQSHFGESNAVGGGSFQAVPAIPEPQAALILLAAAMAVIASSHRSRESGDVKICIEH